MLAIAIVVVLSTAFSFLCSLMEAALYAVPPSRIDAMVRQGVLGADMLKRLRSKIDEPIAAVLTFNTIANSIGATILGGLVGARFGAEWVFVCGVVFAMVILLLAEIIPKTLGVTFADRLAPKLSYIIRGMIIILYPLVRLSIYVTKQIREAGAEKQTVSREDIIASTHIAQSENSVLENEARIVVNTLRLRERTAHEIMTPRTVVYILPRELPLSMVSSHSEHWMHSRIPLCEKNNPDKVVGLVYRREVFDAMLTTSEEEMETFTLQKLAHPVEFIPETLNGLEILRRFLDTRQHLFIVSNEHGGMEGIITLEDVIEELLGEEIVDQHDVHEDMQEYARRVAELKRKKLEQSYN